MSAMAMMWRISQECHRHLTRSTRELLTLPSLSHPMVVHKIDLPYALLILTCIQEPSHNMPITVSGRDDAVPIMSSELSRDAANLASPHSVTTVASMETIYPVKSLILRRTSGSAIYTQCPRQPLRDPLIARLLHHYINNLACWVHTLSYSHCFFY